VPSVLGNLQNTEANLEALAGKSLNVEDIFVEEELEVKREEEEEEKREELEVKREEEKEEGKRVEKEGKEEDMMEKSEIEEDLKDNKIFTDVKGFFNPQSRALQVSYLFIYLFKNY
jgi:hypothetical protein